MKSKVESKKAVSSDSSSSDSSDDEPTIKAPSKAAAAAAKTTTPKSSQEKVTPAKAEKLAKASKVKESAIPKSVPATKFPKRNTTSSSDSSSSSDEEPVAKKVKPANNKVANTNSHPVVTTPKHQPVVNAVVHQSPKRDPPAHVATPVKRALGSQVPAPTPAVVAPPKTVPVIAAGGEQYKRTDTKKEVTNLFGSNCPHCGHDIEVRLKLS